MTDKHYIKQSETDRLRSWILSEMLSGAGKAALFVLAIGFVLYAIYGLGLLLPEQSKQAPSPQQQQGAIEAPLEMTRLA